MISQRRKNNGLLSDGIRYGDVPSSLVVADARVGDDIETGKQIMDEAVKEPTLDTFLDGNPKRLNDEDYPALIAILRANRARDIEKGKKGKKDEEN